jgi:Family of unknown function (DUF5995)
VEEAATEARLTATPTGTVPDVIVRLRTLASGRDGVACFARLYLAVTEGVNARLSAADFVNPAFVARLDVTFAELFFAAVADPARAPRAWAPLFEARSRRGIAPLQFALAGMNAHINRDLPVAVVATCSDLGVEPGPQYRDFNRVNPILAEVERSAKASLLSGWIGLLDRILHRFHRLDDVAAMWNVVRAREAAWTNAQVLWTLRHEPDLGADFLETLDRTVGLAGRGLLRRL